MIDIPDNFRLDSIRVLQKIMIMKGKDIVKALKN